jgi:hypothetical protein
MTRILRDWLNRFLGGNDMALRRRAKVFIIAHALVSVCLCFVGFEEQLIGRTWLPRPVDVLIEAVAVLGACPFLAASPILIVAMLARSHCHREWTYLALCDAALLVLLFAGTFVASL